MVIYRDKIGVNVHSAAAAYKNQIPTAKAKLDELGITWLRDNNHNGPSVWGANYNVVYVSDTPYGNIADVDYKVEAAIAGGCKAIELTNEPPIGTETDPQDVQINARIISKVAGRVPIWNSAFASPSTSRATQYYPNDGNIAAGSYHPYRANRSQTDWDTRLNQFYALIPIQSGTKPWHITETGWHDYTGPYNDGHLPTPDATAAVQVISDTERMWNDGAGLVFLYELYDENLYKNQAATKAVHEGWFGLVRNDWSNKPQATALKNYLATNGNLTWSANGPVTPPPSGGSGAANDLIVGGVNSQTINDMVIMLDGVRTPVSQLLYRTGDVTSEIWNPSRNQG